MLPGRAVGEGPEAEDGQRSKGARRAPNGDQEQQLHPIRPLSPPFTPNPSARAQLLGWSIEVKSRTIGARAADVCIWPPGIDGEPIPMADRRQSTGIRSFKALEL